MPATIVMGGQWGDEGKGKLTDSLAASAAIVIRANGGANAGTPSRPTRERLRSTSSHPASSTRTVSPSSARVWWSIQSSSSRRSTISRRGISLEPLRISERAHVVMPYHPILDGLDEEQRGEGSIGTTLRGIGPAYSDKAARRGLRMVDLVDREPCATGYARSCRVGTGCWSGSTARRPWTSTRSWGACQLRRAPAPICLPDGIDHFDALSTGANHRRVRTGRHARHRLRHVPVCDVVLHLGGRRVPGRGVPPTSVDRVLGVYKAYSTRVGAGPLPTELDDATGQLIRDRGHEYGTTTGRPRRTGWFDAVAARHVARLNGVSDIALTLLDVFDVFETIQVCVAYEIDGELVDAVPARSDRLARVRRSTRHSQVGESRPSARGAPRIFRNWRSTI